MLKMLGKFLRWFIILGLSLFVELFLGWTEQGKAFLILELIVNAVSVVVGAISLIIYSNVTEIVVGKRLLVTLKSSISILLTVINVFIVLFATWGATKLFSVDFFVAYQIMTFGQCLCVENNKEKSKETE